MRGENGHGSLREWGINYAEVPLDELGSINWEAFQKSLKPGELSPQRTSQTYCAGVATNVTLHLLQWWLTSASFMALLHPGSLIIPNSAYQDLLKTCLILCAAKP